MIWLFINAFCSAIVACILTYKLAMFPDNFSFLERLGMGVLGAAMVLNIAPIVQSEGSPFHCREPTPFDDWGSTLIRIGVALYFIGRLIRNHRHMRNNAEAVARAKEHFDRKR